MVILESDPPTVLTGLTDINFNSTPFNMNITYPRVPIQRITPFQLQASESTSTLARYFENFGVSLIEKDKEHLISARAKHLINFSQAIHLPTPGVIKELDLH